MTNLLKYLWKESIKMALYIWNRVPNKFVAKTPFQLKTSRKTSLNYFLIWGCIVEVRIYNPSEKKMDPLSIRCYFVWYLPHFKEYKFYCPSHSTRIVEAQIAKFLEFNVHDASRSIEILVIVDSLIDVHEKVVTFLLPPSFGINDSIRREITEA